MPMPRTSRPSGRPAEAVLAPETAPGTRPAAVAAEPECWTIAREAWPRGAAAVVRRLGALMRDWGYRSAVYRWRLAGKHPNKLLASPDDPWPGEPERGQAVLDGVLPVGEARLDLEHPDIWRRAASSAVFAEPALDFSWLRDLAQVADQRRAQGRAEALTCGFLDVYALYHSRAWAPLITARRLSNWMLHAPLILSSGDLVYRSAVLNALARQARHLSLTAERTAPGLPRLEAACGLAMSGILLPHGHGRRARGEALLARALGRFVLPDGGVASRKPADALAAMQHLIGLREAYHEAGVETPKDLQPALDRLGPFVRALLHGDGRPAHINGFALVPAERIEAVLQASHARGRAIGNARHTGLMRVSARKTLLIWDAMPPPAGPMSHTAHAGTLSFELSDGAARLIVNIGAGRGELAALSRTTAAHSTLVLADTNSTELRRDGTLGAGIAAVALEQAEDASGTAVAATHDGYQRRFKLRHRRQLTLSAAGDRLNGVDRLEPVGRGPRRARAFDIRFHLHPGVAASPTQGGRTVVLRLPNRHGWLFTLEEGAARLEDSLYFEDGQPRRTQQIVIVGEAGRAGAEVRWSLERQEGGRGGHAA